MAQVCVVHVVLKRKGGAATTFSPPQTTAKTPLQPTSSPPTFATRENTAEISYDQHGNPYAQTIVLFCRAASKQCQSGHCGFAMRWVGQPHRHYCRDCHAQQRRAEARAEASAHWGTQNQ